MKKNHSITAFWDRGAIKPDKTSRVMLTVNLNRKQFRICLKIYCTEREFKKDREKQREIGVYISKAESIFERMPSIDKANFIMFFKSDAELTISSMTDIFIFYERKYKRLMIENRFGSASCLKNAFDSLRSFKGAINFEDIDIAFLNRYKIAMRAKGLSDTTIGMYIRALRSLVNEVIGDGIIPAYKIYPFTNKRGSIALTTSIKSKFVLSSDQIRLLWEYVPIGIAETRAKDLFFFCYSGNGMNFADAARLRFKDIRGNFIYFTRQKTIYTKREQKEIRVYITREIARIIEKYKDINKCGANDYLFKFINNYASSGAYRLNRTILRYKAGANKMLHRISKKIAAKLLLEKSDIKFDIMANIALARHSFATMHRDSGTEVAEISEMMGHSDVKITSHYLKSLPDKRLEILSDKLLSF